MHSDALFLNLVDLLGAGADTKSFGGDIVLTEATDSGRQNK